MTAARWRVVRDDTGDQVAGPFATQRAAILAASALLGVSWKRRHRVTTYRRTYRGIMGVRAGDPSLPFGYRVIPYA